MPSFLKRLLPFLFLGAVLLPAAAQAQKQQQQPLQEQQQQPPQQQRPMTPEEMDRMIRAMFDTMIEIMIDPRVAKMQAAYMRSLYDELIAQGFSEEQAFQICLSHSPLQLQSN